MQASYDQYMPYLFSRAGAAGVACAQDDAPGNEGCPQGKAWSHPGGQPAWGQMDKRGNDNVNHSAHLAGAAFGVMFMLFMEPQVLQVFLEQLMNPRFGR